MPALSKDEIDAMMKGKKTSNLMKNKKNLHFKLIYKVSLRKPLLSI